MFPQKPVADRPGANTPDPPPADPQVICRLLSDILGRNVTSKKVAPYPFVSPTRLVAAYMAESVVVSICVFDVAFAAHSGAALALMPVGIAAESVKAGKCASGLLENFAEILNICRQAFQRQASYVDPPQLYGTPKEVPQPIAAVLSKPKSRVDMDVTIPGYGTGRFSVVS